jgi:hypothetical protein
MAHRLGRVEFLFDLTAEGVADVPDVTYGAWRRNVVGVVTNGSIRDSPQTRRLDIAVLAGHEAGEFVAGYIAEYSLLRTDSYVGGRILVRKDGRRRFTPMLIAILAIGVANVVFAVDSIPAIFGLTTDPYNAFALRGLRMLYFPVAPCCADCTTSTSDCASSCASSA